MERRYHEERQKQCEKQRQTDEEDVRCQAEEEDARCETEQEPETETVRRSKNIFTVNTSQTARKGSERYRKCRGSEGQLQPRSQRWGRVLG